MINLNSTNPAINPYQRKTGVRTYFQAIWDTINFTDFVLEIYYALKFFVDFMRGKPGTRAESTKLQQTLVSPIPTRFPFTIYRWEIF